MENNENINKLKQIFLKEDSLNNNGLFNIDEIKKELLNYYSSLTIYHPDIIIIFSKEAEIISADNKKIHSLLGKTINNADDLKELLFGENYQIMEDAFTQTLNGKSEKYNIEIKDINDKSLYLALTFIPIINEGEVEGIYMIVADVTDKALLKQQLILRENHLNYAQQIAEIGSWEYLIDEDKLFCSENFYNIFGLDPQNFISMDAPFLLVHPDDEEEAYKKVREAIMYGKSYTNQFRILHGMTNELKYIKVHAEVFFEEHKPYKIIGVIKDETYQIQLENQLVEQNESYKSIYNNLSSGIWMREVIGGKFLFASKGLEKILDIPLSKLYEDSKVWFSMIHPDNLQELENGKKKLASGKSFQTIYKLISGSGKTKWLLEEVVPRLNEAGEVTNIFGLVTDVTQEMEFKEKLNYLSNFDALTGLPNQKSLFERMDALCVNDDPFAIFYLDLDRFNIINDSLGHSIGDEALQFIAKRFEKLIPSNDYLARLSSNDFIMIIKNYKNKKDVYHLAKKIIRKVSEPFTIDDYELNVSTSIGITFFPEEGREKQTLLKNAHTALYQAKKEGKNNYQLSSHLADISSYKKYVLDRDMRKAIANEEFDLYFQPQVETKKGALCGAEALIRWNHKEWGLVSPGEFIPLAEENHMINTITDWVIQKVCRLLVEWREKELPIIPIAINIPPIRFMKKGFLQFVKGQLDRYQIDPAYLEFEITEGTLLNIEKGVYATIQSLKELGIRIAVDDFGTGYASLASIRKFKPNTIKIDKLFICNINKEDNFDNGIISATLHLAKTLEMNVVAEGVEEFDQLNFLKQNKCDIIQGYLFSKPVKVEEFEKILKTGYLKPEKINVKSTPAERRKFLRFEFPFPILGQLTIVELNERKLQVGQTPVLIKNIGMDGLNIQSNLKLPINMNIKFHISFILLNEKFEVNGELKWANEEYTNIFSYGVSIKSDQSTDGRLSSVINKLNTLRKNDEQIPDTEFVYEDVYTYLGKNM
ncbi:EAL domain-containing protein [Solibacillus silvestris]|uniref:EAL domain-containing protein n=1 Tax=Solibacillus silvestris TaxID=76853 RepID=UPI003F80459F